MTKFNSVTKDREETFDLMTHANVQDPFALFARLRSEAPVYWSQKYSFWMVSRYRDVKWILSQPQVFSSVTKDTYLKRREELPSDVHASFDIASRFVHGNLQAYDPPVHTWQRQAVMKDFLPLVTKVVKRSLERRVCALLDAIEEAGTCDFIQAFAYPLPSKVIFDLLGVPDEDHETIRRSSEAMSGFQNATYRRDGDAIVKLGTDFAAAEAVLMRLIESRRREPREDLISYLVRPGNVLEQLPDTDIVVLCVLLLFAGHETTSSLLAGSLRYLLEDRRQWEQLRTAPETLPGAIGELLRFVSPVLWLPRVAQRDVEIGGFLVPKGAQVLVGFGSANHDPEEFDNPELLDITRQNVNSLAFGYGIHSCLGAALARMEVQVAFSQLLTRFPRIQLLTDRFEYHPVYFLRAMKALPVSVNV
jgi:cytochrome P450